MNRLSQREIEVAILVWQDLSNKEIGVRLGITPSTVENHLGNIYEKLEVNTRVGLIRKLLAMKLISADS